MHDTRQDSHYGGSDEKIRVCDGDQSQSTPNGSSWGPQMHDDNKLLGGSLVVGSKLPQPLDTVDNC